LAEDNKDKENKPGVPEVKEGMFDEKTSYSFLFFLMSGALMLVTLWAFWDDEYSRRGYKAYQETYFQVEYDRAKAELNQVSQEVDAKIEEIQNSVFSEEESLDKSDDYLELTDQVFDAQVAYEDVKMDKKFAKSRLDEAYYYYKKAMHLDENYDVQLDTLHGIEKQITNYGPTLVKLASVRDALEEKLLARKAKKEALEKELRKLVTRKDDLKRRMDFYKPFPFFLKAPAVEQTVITGSGLNSFKEIIYKVDRCMTCHISYDNSYYEEYDHPFKTHPNREILIKKHPPKETGCTWCHKGQGSATYPVRDAHGSHHENDQTTGVNEPLLLGNQMQSNCRNCHADVIDLEGAPLLSEGKRLFVKLGCHGCHLADGYQKERKVGPGLLRIASKVNPSWLFRWIKKPKDYLPNTRMPIFDLTDKEVTAVSAYLIGVSDKSYVFPEKFSSGDKDKGKKLFESVGCQACHRLNGKGEVFGPDLSRIGNKVNPDWLVNWVSNPHHYNSKSIMPNLRLSTDDASDITAYLIQFGKPKGIHGIDKMMKDPATIALGEKLVRRRGCFACHDIKGMEAEGRLAPELSNFGAKQVRELEFGDTHIPHTWNSWTRTKLKNPLSYRTERILDKMPDFELSDHDIEALTILLKGFNGVKIPPKYKYSFSEKELVIERGRRLITTFDGKGWHVGEGGGGIIKDYLKGKHLYPPPLDMGQYHVGERLKGSWLFSFLKNPTPVRTWVKVKMPTFALTDNEVRDFTAYFEALSNIDIFYEGGVNVEKQQKNIELGVKIVNTMDCGKCHDDGEKGIEFSIASDRLRQGWISKWLKNTRELIPWTKMPNHWKKNADGTYSIPSKFDELNEVEGGDIDKHIGFISDFIVAYNTAEFDESLSFDSEDGEEDEEEDDGEDEEEDEEEE